jgi:hypothetical protein
MACAMRVCGASQARAQVLAVDRGQASLSGQFDRAGPGHGIDRPLADLGP